MRISDWSSDVCSSDLRQPPRLRKPINMRPDNLRSARYGCYGALLALPLAACGVFKGDGPPKTPTIGERESILSNDNSIQVDPATAAIAVVLPDPTVNAAWAQSGGHASKSMGHTELAATREIGNASCRESGCEWLYVPVGAVFSKIKKKT